MKRIVVLKWPWASNAHVSVTCHLSPGSLLCCCDLLWPLSFVKLPWFNCQICVWLIWPSVTWYFLKFVSFLFLLILKTEIFTYLLSYIFSGLAGIAAIAIGRALYYRRYKRLASKYQHVEFSQYLIHTRVYAQGFFVVCATSIVAKPVFEYLWKKYVKPEDPSPSDQPKSSTNE